MRSIAVRIPARGVFSSFLVSALVARRPIHAQTKEWRGMAFLHILLLTVGALSAQQSIPWLTRAGSNDRHGWNDHETQLTQNSVETKGVSLVTVVPVCCDARGVEAQPLILPQVPTAKGVRDVMVLPSMSDTVRGVDAHTGRGYLGCDTGPVDRWERQYRLAYDQRTLGMPGDWSHRPGHSTRLSSVLGLSRWHR